MQRDSFNKFKAQYKNQPLFASLIAEADRVITAREKELETEISNLRAQVKHLSRQLIF